MANTTRVITVIGVFRDGQTARRAAEALRSAGFRSESTHGLGTEGSAYASGGEAHSGDRGGIAGFFRRFFGADIDEGESRRYEEVVQRGNSLVTVDTDDSQADRVVDIMNQYGAIDIEHDRPMPCQAERVSLEHGEKSIPVVEEELQVGKRLVRRGGVRIYSRVVERPVEEEVTLREEHIDVERRPADRPVSAADTANLRDQTIEVAEMAEEPVVSKRARVVEEIFVGKETTERRETIRDQVRRTDVTVEHVGAGETGSRASVDDTEFREDFERRYAGSGVPYENVAPAYDYGYNAANDARYRGKSWDEVESTLKTDYLRNNPNSTWDNIKGAVRYGWERITGKRRSAG